MKSFWDYILFFAKLSITGLMAFWIAFWIWAIYYQIKPSIEVGEVWVYEYNVDNPYETVTRDTLLIVSDSGDYVQYRVFGEGHSKQGDIKNKSKRSIYGFGRRIK